MTEASFTARYYDGVAARARNVSVRVAGERLSMVADAFAREFDLHDARVSERLEHAPRLITFVDGSYLEVSDHASLDAVLAASGFRDSWVVRWQSHWPLALSAVAATIAVIALGYLYGLPYFARVTAPLIPPTIEARIGAQAAQWLDEHLFAPSRLPDATRERLVARFAQIAPHDGRAYKVAFRASKIGPNAFALPGGTIIMTDELVQLATSDEAVLGVLAHELGHVQQRHLLRRLISSTVTGAAATLLAGDASGVIAAVPATLADLAYSRDMEREADRYAIELLRAHDLPLEPLAQLFESMEHAHAQRDRADEDKAGKGEPAAAAPDWTRYLSTHPDTAARIGEIRAAAQAQR